ncbi:MAG: tripartite tricarboxylate transporter substrate binding protein [Proteobacteria bacterium]|nr:tripartite tricarboxylate transporter substrate binding protein [Burkholderiales bacterium]
MSSGFDAIPRVFHAGQRHRWLPALTVALAAMVCADVVAQSTAYPAKPIRMLVPLAAGSAVDVVGRLVAVGMSADLGQQVVVENLPGAAGLIGTERAARSAPDGYTIAAVNDSIMTVLPQLHVKSPYDSFRDFTPIAQLAAVTWLLVAHPSVPAKSLPALLALAKKRPGEILYASGGNGSPQQLGMELLRSMTRVDLVHVAFKGATPALNDVVAGHVSVMFSATSVALSFVKEGRLRAFGTGSPKRLAVLPEVPTIAEAGVPGFDYVTWAGLVAPAGTPPGVVARLNAAAVRALQRPELRTKVIDLGFELIANTPDEFAQALKRDYQRMGTLIREASIKLD